MFSSTYGGDAGKELDLDPNAINYFAREDSVQPLQRASLPPDFFRLGDNLLQALQQATFPFAMYGQGEAADGRLRDQHAHAIGPASAGARSGTPLSRPTRGCSASWRSSAGRSCSRWWARRFRSALARRSKPAGERRRRDLVFNVARVGDDWECRVSLGDPMPQDEAANLRMAIESTNAGLLSRKTALTKFKIAENAEEERERIAVEQIVQQLAPIEAVKLAQQRGYVPRKLKLPDGWTMTPDGKVMPDEVGGAHGEGAGVDPAMMQALSGQGEPVPELDEMAGAPPPLPGGMLT